MRFITELDPGEMLAVSGAWLGVHLGVFQGIPELKPLVPRVQEDHDGLLSANGGAMAIAALADLEEETTKLDGRHDHLIRAIDKYMEAAREKALAQDPPDTAMADKIDAAYAEILPDGLKVVNLSNEAEVGRAQQMAKTLADKPEVDTVLTSIVTGDKETTRDLVKLVVGVAALLGDAERRKKIAAEVAAQAVIKPSDLRRRMRTWAQTGELVLSVLARTKAPPADVETIRKPVLEAMETARVRKVAERAAAKKKADEEAAAKKKADEEAAAKKKAEEEAAKATTPATPSKDPTSTGGGAG